MSLKQWLDIELTNIRMSQENLWQIFIIRHGQSKSSKDRQRDYAFSLWTEFPILCVLRFQADGVTEIGAEEELELRNLG